MNLQQLIEKMKRIETPVPNETVGSKSSMPVLEEQYRVGEVMLPAGTHIAHGLDQATCDALAREQELLTRHSTPQRRGYRLPSPNYGHKE